MSVHDRDDRQGRVGPFVTFVERVRPDGAVARWDSRRHRKHPPGAPAAGSTWWAPGARGWWIAVLFAVGSLLFALGAVPGYASAVGARWDAVTFFIGSLFFTAAGFLTYREAVDAGRSHCTPPGGASSSTSPAGSTGGRPRCNWPEPCSSTSAPATRCGKTCPRRPRISTCGGRTRLARSASWWPARWPGSRSATAGPGWRPRSWSWWITLLNLIGSVAFGVSAVAGYINPATGQLHNAERSNLGTLIGAVCFLAGALLLLPERTEEAGGQEASGTVTTPTASNT